MLKLVLADLLVDIHVPGVYVRVKRERDKGSGAVVYGMRGTPGNLSKVCSVRDEGSREDDGINELWSDQLNSIDGANKEGKDKDLLGTEEHIGPARRYS